MPIARDKCKSLIPFDSRVGKYHWACPFLLSTGPFVYNAIRAVHPNAPILIFGGHTHIRDCCTFRSVHVILRGMWYSILFVSVQFDGRSMALESGRYMETLGAWIIPPRVFVCVLIFNILGWMSMSYLSKLRTSRINYLSQVSTSTNQILPRILPLAAATLTRTVLLTRFYTFPNLHSDLFLTWK